MKLVAAHWQSSGIQFAIGRLAQYEVLTKLSAKFAANTFEHQYGVHIMDRHRTFKSQACSMDSVHAGVFIVNPGLSMRPDGDYSCRLLERKVCHRAIARLLLTGSDRICRNGAIRADCLQKIVSR